MIKITAEQAQAIRDLDVLTQPATLMQFAQNAKRNNWRELDETMKVLLAMLPENQPKKKTT